MPKQTFFNLSEDKKQVLIDAVVQEFSRVPLFEASISNIVKLANIPRGSFYQYFEDKEDAYFYILNQQIETTKASFELLLKKHDGDLFDTMIETFESTVNDLSSGNSISFLKNVFLNMTYEIENKFNRIFNGNGNVEPLHGMGTLINRENLNITSDKELFHLVQILASVTLRNLIEKLAHDLPAEKALSNYLLEIELLKRGLYREIDPNKQGDCLGRS